MVTFGTPLIKPGDPVQMPPFRPMYGNGSLGFWIPIVSGIPVSLSCIQDSKTQDSRFYQPNFPGVRISQAKISRMSDSVFWRL